MKYIVIIKTDNDFVSGTYLLDVSSSELDKIINAYNYGHPELFLPGRDRIVLRRFRNLIIYELNLERSQQEIENYLNNTADTTVFGASWREEALLKISKNVTRNLLKHGFGELAKPSIKEPTIANDIWTNINPVIARVSKKRFESEHYADAVEAAFKEINDIVKKEYYQKTSKEEDGASLMRSAFSVDKKNLRMPTIPIADNSTASGRDIQDGYANIFTGVMIGIRNPKAHANLDVHPEEAWEMIVLASHLMRMWDKRKQLE